MGKSVFKVFCGRCILRWRHISKIRRQQLSTDLKTNSPTANMSDDESCFSAEERNKKVVAKSMFKTKRERVRTKESDELDETLNQYIEEWRSRRQKEVDELVKLKEKQAKRRVLRAEEEKKLIA